MNGDGKVTNCIEKLAGQIWNHLNESAREDEKDLSNQELIEELEERGHNKGTEIYEIY